MKFGGGSGGDSGGFTISMDSSKIYFSTKYNA